MKAAIENILHTVRMMAWSWRFVHTWRVCFVLCSIFSIMQNAWMSITSAYLIGQTTAHAATGDFMAMLGTIGLIAAIAAAGIITITITNYYTLQINILGLAQLRKAIFAKLSAMPAADAERQLSGDLSTRMSMDAERTATFFSSTMTGDRSLFAIPVSMMISSVICIVKLPVVGILDFMILLVSIYVNLACIRREYAAHSKRMEGMSALTQHMVDIISGSVVARMFRLVQQRRKDYETDSATAYSHAMHGAKYNAMRSSLSSAIQWGAIIFTLVAGGIFVHLKVTDLGTVVFIVLMQSQINNDVLLMLNSYDQLQYATIGATRVKAILDHSDEQMRENTVDPELNAEDVIAMQRVTVCYEKGTPVLKELSLTVKNGERLAIVGGSGGGKTTMMKYIMEFVDADSGSIKLFEQPRDRYSQEAVRELMAYVPQNCYLFDGSIRENIVCGNKLATDESIGERFARCRFAGIDRSPARWYRYACRRTRCAIVGWPAAAHCNCPRYGESCALLLLDEATSALDGESEEAIQRALDRLMQGRTAM